MNNMKSWLLSGIVLAASILELSAQNLINVKPYSGSLSGISGPAVVGSAGDTWNLFGNLQTNSTGYLTNAATIKDSSGATVSGVSMTLAINTASQPLSGYSSANYNPNPAAIMQNYIYDGNGDYFTVVFNGLPTSKPYLIYGMGTGNAQTQGTTWWADTANGHANATCTANFTSGTPLGTRDATQATNQDVCWVQIPATTTAAGALTFRVCKLGATESGGVVSGGSGRAYLNAFQLQPASAPVISGLINQTVIAGSNAVLNPAISGVPTPSYQWRSNSIPIVGGTNATLVLNSIQSAQNGVAYSLVASNWVGAVTNSMMLTVIVPSGITGLNNQAVPVGANVTNAATISGVPTPALRWQFNGNPLSDGATGNGSTVSGSTTSTLVLLNAQAADGGSYSLVASNSAGTITNSLTLTVSSGNVAPNIIGPTDQTVVQSNNATFSASVSGLPIPILQWQVNGSNIPGATNSSLAVTNVQYPQNGFVYSLVASNSAGLATNSAKLYVLVPPSISQSPTNLAVVVGSPAAFSVVAGGVPAPSYQWNRNGNPISGATGATYTLANPQGADNGAVFTVTVSNSVSTATSSGATLTVLSTMTGAFGPTNGAVNISPDQQLRILFSGGTPFLNTNGTLTVRDAADNSMVQTIDASQFLSYTPGNTSIQTIPNAAIRTVQGSYSGSGSGSTTYYFMPIALYGNEAWITLTNRLSYGHTYYVNCDPGLFLDSNGASFAGISGTNTWALSTKSSGPATPTTNGGPVSIAIGQDGAGDFATFQGAFDWIPQNNTLARTLHVLPGIYHDSATLAGNRNFVTIVGDGASRTNAQLIYPFVYFAPPNSVFTAGSLRIESSDVAVENLTLDNIIYGVYHPTGYASSGAPTNFAGAINTLATTGRRIVFNNVLIKGGQDTIYHNSSTGIVYLYNCEIRGSVDFIYGNSLAVYDQCNIVEIRNTGGPCTAPNTLYAQPYGLTFLNCTFRRALVANGYPYDVTAGSTTFQRAWGQDGMTTIFNCAVDSQISTTGWGTFGSGGENTCRAREYGTMLIGGGSATTIAQRQAAGTYWLNTLDPDYTNNPSLSPTNALLAPPTGTNNRVAVTINPGDYTLSAIFGNSYFNLSGWMPSVLPAITLQPTNQTVSLGSTAVFTVSAIGLPMPTYQWLKNSTNYPGATNATLVITNAQPTDAASYSVVVSNATGTVTSTNTTLTLAGVAPAITTQPTNKMVVSGGTAVFTAVASGQPAPTYQWLKNGSTLLNATNATLTLANVSAADIGAYSLIVVNNFGTAMSVNAALTLNGGAVQSPVINFNNILVVTNSPYNAVGDGVTDNTAAIQSAINAASLGGLTNGLRGGTAEIPANTNAYLCGPLNFSNNVNLQLDAGAVLRMLPFGQYPMTWFTNGANVYFVVTANFISGNNLTNIEISGSGAIDGQGSPWWPWAYTNNAVRPVMISLSGCNRELIQNVTLSNSPSVHIGGFSASSGNTTIQYVTERAPSSYDPTNPSHNTDACDIRGTNTLVQFNNVSVGDDDFSCLGNTSGAVISNNVYGDGHGTSIGSQIAGGVSNFLFINCTYTNTDACAHIKSDRDRGGFVHNINYYNLTFTNVMHPIQIYCEYTNKTTPALDSVTPGAAAALAAAPVTATTPYYRDITISNFTGNAQSGRAAGLLWGLPESSISNVTLVNVNLTGSKTFGIYDAKNIQIIDSTHNVPAGVSQYSFFDADVTFSNSAPSTSLVTLDGATANGIANSFKFFNSLMTLSSTNAMALNSSVTLDASTFIISNNLTVTPSNNFTFYLGTNAATVVVKGSLTLGGIINAAAGPGFTNGTYTLMTYTGSLNGSLPVLGTTPAGYVCSLNTNTAGQVKLVVATPAGIPGNLTAQGTNLLINLNWFAASNATGYNLKRSTTNGGSYSLLANLTATNYADAAVMPGTTYYYVVSATNATGESANSLQASAVPLPSLVSTNLNAQINGNNLQLSWPPDHLGWRLQIQSNNLNSGLGTNWVDWPGTTNVVQTNLIINPANGSVFLRQVYP